MLIEIVNVTVETVPTARGQYKKAKIIYKNKSLQDKVEEKQIMDFTFPNVFNKLEQSKFGDVFEIDRVKNDKGYWDWVGFNNETKGEEQVMIPSTNKGPTPSPKSTYETPEERAIRQVMIVRQSSLSTAVAMLEAAADKKTPINPDTVITVAKQFEAYVFGKDAVAPAIEETPPGNFFEDMEDDLP